VDKITFENFDNQTCLSELLRKGRIFNADFEIRYERRDNGDYELFVLFEDETKIQSLNLDEKPYDYECSECVYNIFLWGEARQINEEWKFIEVRIPQELEYPEVDNLEKKDELVIKFYEYKTDKIPQFNRFIGVEKYVPESN
jgi:tRNA U34 5-carboxymethylaminomethyl modifying enzyme MnmG/GidA